MELRVLRLREPNLGQQLPDEAYVSTRIMPILGQPLRERPNRQRSATCVREERLLGGVSEGVRADGEQVTGQRGRGLRRRIADGVRREWLPVTATFWVGASPMDLEVWVWLLAIQYAAGALGASGACRRPVRCLLRKVRLRFRRVEVGLALLEMLDLARCVLCTDEAAVLTSDLIAFSRSLRVLELCKRATDVRIGVATHGGSKVQRQSSCLQRQSAPWSATCSRLEIAGVV